jgi:hypothetical protein
VEKLEHPLMDWAAQGKELRVSWYHPLTAKSPSPWPIIQIYVYDPAPEAQTGEGYDDIDFEADSGMEFQKVCSPAHLVGTIIRKSPLLLRLRHVRFVQPL